MPRGTRVSALVTLSVGVIRPPRAGCSHSHATLPGATPAVARELIARGTAIDTVSHGSVRCRRDARDHDPQVNRPDPAGGTAQGSIGAR